MADAGGGLLWLLLQQREKVPCGVGVPRCVKDASGAALKI